MLHTLHNDQLWVQVSAHGAEPMHLRDKTGTELLWQGDPAVWPRRAPLLFPFIGRLKNETYTVGGQAYHIPIHGFGPDSDFTPVEQSDTALTLRLTDSDATRAQYPFAFQLDVRFTLDGNRLTKACTMTNRSDVPLAYELGGHEGYRVALAADECAADAYIDCGVETVLHPYCSDEALYLLDKTREVPLENGRLYLRPGLFDQDALILSDLKQRSLTLVQAHGQRRITVDFDDFDYVGIWSHPTIPSDYVCIEPWSSLPDFHAPGTELTEKWGVRTLAPGVSETLRYTVTVEA